MFVCLFVFDVVVVLYVLWCTRYAWGYGKRMREGMVNGKKTRRSKEEEKTRERQVRDLGLLSMLIRCAYVVVFVSGFFKIFCGLVLFSISVFRSVLFCSVPFRLCLAKAIIHHHTSLSSSLFSQKMV